MHRGVTILPLNAIVSQRACNSPSLYVIEYLPGAVGSGVSLDSGLMEGMSRLELIEQSVPITRSVARPGGGSMKEFTNWDALSHPVLDVNLDGRPMEGTTYLEHSAPGVSLDSGLMEGMSSPELLEQSVLGSVVGHTTGGDRRASSGITGEPRTVTFEIVGAADVGS